MNDTVTKTYRVVATELIRRTYLVTTPGDESHAAALAEAGDFGARPNESVQLLEDEDVLCDVSIDSVACSAPAEGSTA